MKVIVLLFHLGCFFHGSGDFHIGAIMAGAIRVRACIDVADLENRSLLEIVADSKRNRVKCSSNATITIENNSIQDTSLHGSLLHGASTAHSELHILNSAGQEKTTVALVPQDFPPLQASAVLVLFLIALTGCCCGIACRDVSTRPKEKSTKERLTLTASNMKQSTRPQCDALEANQISSSSQSPHKSACSRANVEKLMPNPGERDTTTLKGEDTLASQFFRNFHVALFFVMGVGIWWHWGTQAAVLSYNVMLAMILGILARSVHSMCCRRRSDRQDGYCLQRDSWSQPQDELEANKQCRELPAATVYVTVYREPFDEVLRPTLLQAIRVVQHYNRIAQATKANLIVLDDGLLAVSKEEYARRKAFYHACGISYTARPRNGDHGYEREGFFKKSGNLNFVHRLDKLRREKQIQGDAHNLRVHAELLDSIDVDKALENPGLPVGCRCTCCDTQTSPWSVYSELVEPLAPLTIHKEPRVNFLQSLGLAELHGDCSLGDYCMLLDNDSWAPEASLVDSVQIMMQDDHIGFVQHHSGPLNLYENFVTEVYGAGAFVFWGLLMPVRAWACPPALLGHNVVLRKEAIEAAGLYHIGRGSDDVATNINMRASSNFRGLFVQLYPEGSGFLEGVEGSYMVIASQLRRYGAISHSLIFNPMPDWWEKGMLDEGFKKYIFAPNVTCREIFDTFLFFYGGLQGSILFFVLMPMMIFAAWKYIFTGSSDSLLDSSGGAMIGFIVAICIHAIVSLLLVVSVPRQQVKATTCLKFTFVGPFLYSSLWWSFIVGFGFDHFFKDNSTYSSTRKDKCAPTFMQLLSVHCVQIVVALIAVAPFICLLFDTDLDMPLRERLRVSCPMCLMGLSMLVCPFAFETFTWTTPIDCAVVSQTETPSFFERCENIRRRLGIAIYAALENMKKTLTLQAGGRGIAVVDGLRSLALLWMLSHLAFGFWFSWKHHNNGWWEWLGTFDAGSDRKPSAYLSLLQASTMRLVRSGSLAGDIFLVLSGFLVGRSFIEWRTETGPVRMYFSFVVQRWCRLVPVLVASYFMGKLLPMFWEFREYAQWNSLPGFSGYPARHVLAEFQLYAVTPCIMTLLLPMSHSASGFLRPTLCTIFLFAICVALRGALLWNYGALHGGVKLLPIMDFYKAHIRASSYFCGLFVACLHHISCEPWLLMTKTLSTLTSSMALVSMLVMAYVGTADSPELVFEWNRSSPLLHLIVFALGRPMFGAMCAYLLWVMLSEHGKSWLIVSFLSQRVWAPVSAIAYSSYAIHIVPLAVTAQLGQAFLSLQRGDDVFDKFAPYVAFYLVFVALALVPGLLLHGIIEMPFEALRRSLSPKDSSLAARA